MSNKPYLGQMVFFVIEGTRCKGKVIKNLVNASIVEFDSSSVDKNRNIPLHGKTVISFKDIRCS